LPPLIFFDFRLRHSPTPPLMLISCIWYAAAYAFRFHW
jgi:hypothetical protein